MPTHLPIFNAIDPRRLNRVSRHLKTIGGGGDWIP